jgi:hypothetical protein
MQDHDWKRMMRDENEEQIEMFSADDNLGWSAGFWIGSISGAIATFLLCLAVGLYYTN